MHATPFIARITAAMGLHKFIALCYGSSVSILYLMFLGIYLLLSCEMLLTKWSRV